MKIIELLNKIANGEDVPEKIKFREEVYDYDSVVKHYVELDSQEPLMWQYNGLILNEKVEIIEDEEEPKMFEQEWFNSNEGIMNIVEVDLAVKINELIKAVKQLDKNIKELR